MLGLFRRILLRLTHSSFTMVINLISIANAENHDLKDVGLQRFHSHFRSLTLHLYIAIPDFHLAQWGEHAPLSQGVMCNLSQFVLCYRSKQSKYSGSRCPFLDVDQQEAEVTGLCLCHSQRNCSLQLHKEKGRCRAASASKPLRTAMLIADVLPIYVRIADMVQSFLWLDLSQAFGSFFSVGLGMIVMCGNSSCHDACNIHFCSCCCCCCC